MRKIIFCLMIIIVTFSLFSTTWTVGPGGGYDFLTIQAAINDNLVQSGDVLSVYNDTYGAIDLGSKYLSIAAANGQNPSISASTGYIVDFGSASGSSLAGFNIVGTSNADGILIDECDIIITNCEISDTGVGVTITDTHPFEVDVDINTTKFYENTTAISMEGNQSLELLGCLFHTNSAAFNIDNSGQNDCSMDRVTITENTLGFDWGTNADFYLTNSIVYNNTTNFSGTPYDLDCDYSDIEGGFVGGTDNIDDDPYFCSEYPFEYWLMEGSPCIDTGDPSTPYADERADMGCFETTYDIKPCKSEQYNYVSFQRLNRSGNNTYNVVDVIDNFLDWPLSDLTLDDITGTVLEYEFPVWSSGTYNVRSTEGFKLFTEDSGHHYMPTCYNASRLSASTRLDLPGETDNWLGYWLPYTQNIEDAFGDFWEDVYSVEAEDWYYEYSEFETPTSSTTNKNMIYGKAYIIVFYDDVGEFLWTDATSRGTNRIITNPVPQYFSFDYQMNYEALDVMEIPSNVVEIGVFEEDTCVGAVVVQEEDEQILVYSTEVNRDNVPLTFQVVTTNRGENLAVSDYRVMNKATGCWENRSLISGSQRSSVAMFGNLEEIQNTTPNSSIQISNLSNYPNPFNPTTMISFDLNTELIEDTEITIYNMKGQKVKTLPIPESQSLTVSVSWDGTDDECKKVSSGLYFYKLKTANNEYSKKMLLLK